MGRKKLDRFDDNAERYNVIQAGKDNFCQLAGKWKSDHFKNDNNLVAELGCGKGEYSVGLGEKFVYKNFIGIDIKGSRIWVGSSYAIEHKLLNVAFLRTHIESLDQHFSQNELDEIWITFPDPRSRDRDEKRRLTTPNFMKMYQSLLKDDGWLKFKTDNTGLFDYTLECIKNDSVKVKSLSFTYDLYHSEYTSEHFGVKTKYEKLFYDKGDNIKYMKFQFT